jgi:hypothetical protein
VLKLLRGRKNWEKKMEIFRALQKTFLVLLVEINQKRGEKGKAAPTATRHCAMKISPRRSEKEKNRFRSFFV